MNEILVHFNELEKELFELLDLLNRVVDRQERYKKKIIGKIKRFKWATAFKMGRIYHHEFNWFRRCLNQMVIEKAYQYNDLKKYLEKVN